MGTEFGYMPGQSVRLQNIKLHTSPTTETFGGIGSSQRQRTRDNCQNAAHIS